MNKKDLEEMWVGMPEYIQENKEAIKRVTINFEREEDIAEFNRLTGLNVTMKTKGIFFPKTNSPKVKYIKDDD